MRLRMFSFPPFHISPVMLLPLIAFTCGCTSPTTAEDENEPVLSLGGTILAFGAVDDALPLVISNTGGGELEWKVVTAILPEWCTVRPESGLGPAELKVMVDRSGLKPGEYSGELAIRSNGGERSIKITMTVSESDDTGIIIIDTPIPDSTTSR